MRRELKRLNVAAFLLTVSLAALLTPQLSVSATAGANRPAAAPQAKDERVIACVALAAFQEQWLAREGVRFLNAPESQGRIIETTRAVYEQLEGEGWAVEALFVRGPGEADQWRAVEGVLGDCAYTVTPDHRSFPAVAGGSTSFTMTTAPDCEWVMFTNVDWIFITGPLQGTGSVTVNYVVQDNTTGSPRSGVIFIGDQFHQVFQGIPFSDVPVGHPFYNEIGKLSARGVTLGCGGGRFCPGALVTREQMAAFIMRARGEFNPPAPAMQRFADVPPSNIFYAFIERLAELGITQGCGGGNYCPSAVVTREQMAAFIIRGLGIFDPPEPLTQRFIDVPPTNIFYRFIDQMAARGITQGCSQDPPRYCPSAVVTREQMAAFLVRAFDL